MRKFVAPDLEVIHFEIEDVITTSGDGIIDDLPEEEF